MNETEIMRQIQVEAPKHGCRLFRNNVGLFYSQNATPTRCGLCEGSSDLIGWTKDGRFLAVEVKSLTGRMEQEQIAFALAVQKAGGVAFTARSAEEFCERICRAYQLPYTGKI